MFDDILEEQPEHKDIYDEWMEARDLIRQARDEIIDIRGDATELIKSIVDFINRNPDRDIKEDFPDIHEEIQECVDWFKQKEEEDGDD